MIQTFDFIPYINRRPKDKQRIMDAICGTDESEVVIDRYRIILSPEEQYVTIKRASESVPFAEKIISCRLSYDDFKNLLEGSFDEMTKVEWLE